MNRTGVQIAGVAMALAAIVICIAWLDRPISTLSYEILGHYYRLRVMTQSPSFFDASTVAITLAFVVRRLARATLGRLDAALIIGALSEIGTQQAVGALKVLFGRTWPLYHNPSFISDGVYGFTFLRGGEAYESFPSGHSASIAAVLAVVWTFYPRLRGLGALALLGIVAALTLGDFHFLSDCIAGALVGCVLGGLLVRAIEPALAEPLRAPSRQQFNS
jgi:membrane-associated phospholipid phosphatase